MELEFVCHASVIVRTPGAAIWTDPWLFGKAFNDSWSLLPEPSFDLQRLDEIDYLWVSHEHPDHFHIPTLRALPVEFKRRVCVLFQDLTSTKMIDAFRRLGFEQIRTLRHREPVALDPHTTVYCYQVGQMDSCLAVISGETTVLNMNDAEVSPRDLAILRSDLGSPDVVLTQFSIAGYSGWVDVDRHLPPKAEAKLQAMVEIHRLLEAKVTMPFASFVYFSCADNAYINDYANTPQDVVEAFDRQALATAVLYPGDVMKVGEGHDSQQALQRYAEDFADPSRRAYASDRRVPLEDVEASFRQFCGRMRENFPSLVLRLLRPVTIDVPDLGQRVRISVTAQRFEVGVTEPPALIVNSQPLECAFKHPFGVQTLGVSARLKLLRNERNWRMHRLLCSLVNADVSLRPSRLLTRKNLQVMRRRWRGALAQVAHRMAIRRA